MSSHPSDLEASGSPATTSLLELTACVVESTRYGDEAVLVAVGERPGSETEGEHWLLAPSLQDDILYIPSY